MNAFWLFCVQAFIYLCLICVCIMLAVNALEPFIGRQSCKPKRRRKK